MHSFQNKLSENVACSSIETRQEEYEDEGWVSDTWISDFVFNLDSALSLSLLLAPSHCFIYHFLLGKWDKVLNIREINIFPSVRYVLLNKSLSNFMHDLHLLLVQRDSNPFQFNATRHPYPFRICHV